MGCDIHAFMEIKINGTWHTYNKPRIDRSYQLFAYMAGVRNHQNEITPISEPRGLPQDISLVAGLEYKDEEKDAHSCSFLTKEEMRLVEDFWRGKGNPSWTPLFGYVSGNCPSSVGVNQEGSYPPEFEDCRLVFWFDN